MNIDGAFKASLRMASTGGLIGDHNGRWIQRFTDNIGTCTIIITELWGILIGLQMAWNRGSQKILLEVDSLTAIKLIDKETTAHNRNGSLVRHIQEWLIKEWEVKMKHIFREANSCADKLTNIVATYFIGI